LNIYSPILVSEFGRLIKSREEQRENALFPILVTPVSESKIVTEVKEVQFKNAYSPILVTEPGMVIEVRPLFQNASFPILVTESGRMIESRDVQL
jgi:hypothetical protein